MLFINIIYHLPAILLFTSISQGKYYTFHLTTTKYINKIFHNLNILNKEHILHPIHLNRNKIYTQTKASSTGYLNSSDYPKFNQKNIKQFNYTLYLLLFIFNHQPQRTPCILSSTITDLSTHPIHLKFNHASLNHTITYSIILFTYLLFTSTYN
jgi:hypothetical protein